MMRGLEGNEIKLDKIDLYYNVGLARVEPVFTTMRGDYYPNTVLVLIYNP